MAEHDDALLDEDLASLPDINDEEYEMDINNDDTTISSQGSVSDQLSCDFESSIEDILEITDLNACEEFEKSVVVELESNISHIKNIKQENIEDVYSDEDECTVQFDSKDALPINKSKLSKDNSELETRCKTIGQYQANKQEYKSVCKNVTEYQQIQLVEKESHSPNSDRCVPDENHGYIQPMDKLCDPSFYQPYYNFQDQRTNWGLNHSFLSNEPPTHELHSTDHLRNQPFFCYNHNSYTNYEYHPRGPTCFYHPSNQSPSFANNFLSLQMSHGRVPRMTNTCQPALVDFAGQMMYNQNNILPSYFDATRCNQPFLQSQNQPQYVLNPLYNHNHSSKQKVLVNRHFSPNGARRENGLYDELIAKTDLFLKKIATKKMRNKSWSGFSRSTNNMDPYSYFSDIWQTKDASESSNHSPDRSLSPEYSPKASVLKKQKYITIKDDGKLRKAYKTNASSVIRKASNIRKKNMKFRNNCQKKRKNAECKTKKIGGVKNTPDENKQKDIVIKKEEKMDPEMIEYCKKIEEQKRKRDKFLQEKEIRRKQLAMEKVGIKIKMEPFADFHEVKIEPQ